MPTDFKPGPFWLRDEPPPALAVMAGAPFAALRDELGARVGAGDVVLGPIADTIASVNADGLDAEFTATVDAAGAEVDAQRGAGDDLTAPALVDAGGSVDSLRDVVLPHLPGPDLPIPLDFTEPPGPPPGAAPDPGVGPGEPPVP